MENLEIINSKIKGMLENWSKDPVHNYGNTITKWIIYATLNDPYDGWAVDCNSVVIDGSASIEDVFKAACNIPLSGTPDCVIGSTEIVQYISVYDVDKGRYVEKASAIWSFEEFKEFVDDKICRSDKFLFGKDGWWNEYVA